jgi:two-component system response regulator HydG
MTRDYYQEKLKSMNYKNSILIVDDDRNLRFALGKLLNSWGYEIFEADDGMIAIEVIQKQSFNLVIMDINMREVSGLAALIEIKSYNAEIPVIIMSGQTSIENSTKAINDGASSFLAKPFSPNELRLAINRALDYE